MFSRLPLPSTEHTTNFAAYSGTSKDNLTMSDPGHIIEKHMRDLHSDFCNYVSSQTNEHIQRINDLEKQLRDSNIVNEYLQKKSHDTIDEINKMRAELKEREERDRVAERRIVCLIDGDGCIFATPYLTQGRSGGRLAAQKLTEAIRQHSSFDQYQLHVWVFVNKRGLSDTLKKCNKKDAADGLDAFILGFNQAAERFVMVDVGDGKEMVDSKIKVHLEDEAKSPQTFKIIFGGCHDHGYLTTISSLITGGYEQKLILLPGYSEMASGYRSLNIPIVDVPELFEQDKLNTASIPSSPPGLGTFPTRARSSTQSSGGSPPLSTASYTDAIRTPYTDAVRAPASPALKRAVPTGPPRARHIDPTKPLNKQEPPPCNLFYLTRICKSGVNCVFAHDYALKPEHFEEMKQNAKKSPCAAMNRGEYCTFGDNCCYGHKCPYSTRCHFYKTGSCKFIGAGMHAE